MSAQGRVIIADVLEAAAAALRKHGSAMQQAAEAGTLQAAEASEAAVNVGKEMVSGTVGLAQTAADVMADVVTSALTGINEGDEANRRGRARKRKATTA